MKTPPAPLWNTFAGLTQLICRVGDFYHTYLSRQVHKRRWTTLPVSSLSSPPYSPSLPSLPICLYLSFYRDTPLSLSLSLACSHFPQVSCLCVLLSLSVSSCYRLSTTVFRETHNPCHDKPQFYFINMERIKVFKKIFIGKPR